MKTKKIIYLFFAIFAILSITNNIKKSKNNNFNIFTLNNIESIASCEVYSSGNNGQCVLSLDQNRYYCITSIYYNDCYSGS